MSQTAAILIVVNAVAWALGAIILFFSIGSLAPTTLRAPLVWSGIAWLLIGAATFTSAPPGSFLHYTSAVAVIAPVMATLGAKRPQNGAWQFIVGTLIVVLLLPMLRSSALDEAQLYVHPLLGWLILAHLVVGVGNYLLTRNWGAAYFYGAGGFMLSAWYSPFELDLKSEGRQHPVVYFFAALGWVWIASARSSKAKPSLQRLWRDFRNLYGAVWTLRVAERLNATAKQHAWPVEFTWGGIVVRSEAASATDDAGLDALEPELRQRIERELRSLLRRFVSHEWIARRLPASRADSSPLAAPSASE